jgi:hypothetical protein
MPAIATTNSVTPMRLMMDLLLAWSQFNSVIATSP